MSAGKTRATSNKRAGESLDKQSLAMAQQTQQQQPAGYSYENVPTQPVPLKYVVSEAVRRWFDDTLSEAQRGDVKQQALVGQMYAEGYGCTRDPKVCGLWLSS